MIERLRSEVMRRNMWVWRAYAALKTEERIASKAKTAIPAAQLAKLRGEIEFCRDQVAAAQISLDAATRFPPLAHRPR